MKTYRIIYIDAFTSQPFSGNPCAVLPEADGLTDGQMQKIAMETNLSETAFVLPSDRACIKVRYFMPHKEIPFAGHPTIATAVMLAQEGVIPNDGPVAVADFEFNIGVLPVEIHRDAAGQPRKAVMTQPKPTFGRVVAMDDVVPCIGLDEKDLLPNVPLQVVSTGVPFLIVPVIDMAVLRKVQVDQAVFQSLLKAIGVDAAYLFCRGGMAPDADAHGRLYTSRAGTEDPFTGSAVGCMGAYMAHHGLRPGLVYTVEQGHIMGRPGNGTVEIIGSAERIASVKVGGCAVRTMEGFINAPI